MRIFEHGLILIGLLLLMVFGGASWWGGHASQRGIDAFAASRLEPASPRDAAAVAAAATPQQHAGAPLAVLRIPGIAMEVPVGAGTNESVLLRGAGLIEGSAVPGSRGNVSIAAHRDTFFRGLADVAVGDLIELDTLETTHRYRITELSVVEPTAIHVLDEIGEPAITLVTCYPFRFIGNAPQRFIVRATAADTLL
jgi:sortase A